MLRVRKLLAIGVVAAIALTIAVGCGKKTLDTPGRKTSDPTMVPPKTKTGAPPGKAPTGNAAEKSSDSTGAVADGSDVQ